MSDGKKIMGTTLLEWYFAREIPPMHMVKYAGESWLQSEPLLLLDKAGKMAVGYCQQTTNGKPEFEPSACSERLEEIYAWALVSKPVD